MIKVYHGKLLFARVCLPLFQQLVGGAGAVVVNQATAGVTRAPRSRDTVSIVGEMTAARTHKYFEVSLQSNMSLSI